MNYECVEQECVWRNKISVLSWSNCWINSPLIGQTKTKKWVSYTQHYFNRTSDLRLLNSHQGTNPRHKADRLTMETLIKIGMTRILCMIHFGFIINMQLYIRLKYFAADINFYIEIIIYSLYWFKTRTKPRSKALNCLFNHVWTF